MEKYLAKLLGVSGNEVSITSGTSSQLKLVEVNGLMLRDIQEKLNSV